MRILVTGGAGFIGSHLSRHLYAQGHEVSIMDRRTDWPDLRTDVKCYRLDCRALSRYVSQWDFCYHLASTVGVANVLADPKECIENIIESTRAVLGLGIPGIYFSSSEVYGKNTEALEEDSACVLGSKKRWSYAAAKLCGEYLALAAGWKVVRLFNVIGPNQNPAYGAVVPRFVNCVINGQPIPVHGDGQQKRTFTSVHDVVEILDFLREKDFDVVNVSSENTVSILELARMVVRLSSPKVQLIEPKHKLPIVLQPYREAYADGFEECPSRIPNISKLRRLIKFYRFRSLTEILTEVIPSAKQEREVRFIQQHAAVHGS